MSNLFDQLEQANKTTEDKRWKGSFRDFLRLFESKEYSDLNATAHQRIENMIMSHGTEKSEFFGQGRIKYNFFENHLFGVEDAVDNIMAYIHAAARKTETSRRMLLLFGPPSSGKSDLVALIKAGLEKYSATKEGAVFAIEGSKMYENPFMLVPEEFRKEFEKQYNTTIVGKLSPHTQWRLNTEFQGKFMDYPVEQIYISESNRVGIGTWLPQDPKGQDQSELVGGIDFAKIQEHGDEADPRSYAFNGELNIANRGLMEFIEGLKADERFLRVLLTATQEKSIKAPRFGLISVDSFIIMHSNEEEFKNFMSEKKYEAYHDRMFIVKVPYNLGSSNEVKIYKKLLSNCDIDSIHIAPHTLVAAAMFSALSRLEPRDGDIGLIKKMKLYDGQHIKGLKTEQVHDFKKKSPREGMTGISPRFVIDQISAAISKAIEEGRNFVTALDVLRQLQKGIINRDSFKQEEKNRYIEYIDAARSEWNDMLRNDIQKAFFLSYDDESRALCSKYLDQIEAVLSGVKPRDQVTGEEYEIDEKLMEAVEGPLDITSSGKESFRNEILRFFGDAARKNRTVDYTQHSQLREAIQKALFQERQGTIRMTVSSRNPDPESLKRLNGVIERMVENQGYTPESANELLKYATARLFDK